MGHVMGDGEEGLQGHIQIGFQRRGGAKQMEQDLYVKNTHQLRQTGGEIEDDEMPGEPIRGPAASSVSVQPTDETS